MTASTMDATFPRSWWSTSFEFHRFVMFHQMLKVMFMVKTALTSGLFQRRLWFQRMLRGPLVMKLNERDIAQQAEAALLECLAKVPGLQVISADSPIPRPVGFGDARVRVQERSGKEWDLLLECKSSGQPAVARLAIGQMLRYQGGNPNAYGVFAAPFISVEAAKLCAQENVGTVDLSGNCRLNFGGVYIERSGQPNRFAEKRELRSLYSPRATRLLRVLLTQPKRIWRLQDLAEEAGVSLGQAFNVKKRLLEKEWLRSETGGLTLIRASALLMEWSENYSWRKNRVRDFYSLQSVAEIEAGLAEGCQAQGIEYALTGFSGAARLAPSVRYQRVMAFVAETGPEKMSALGLKEVPSGANVTLLTPYDDGVFYGAREVDGIRIAAPIQIYLDLIGFRGRGEEAAQTLLEKVIEPTW